MMSTRKEKLITAGCAIVFLVVAVVLIIAGSLLPRWAAVRNTTAEGNVSFSLWTKEECFGIICHTQKMNVKWTTEECWNDPSDGQRKCQEFSGYKIRSDTKCYEANFCNITWTSQGDFDSVPSLVFVAKAFETPAIFSALISIILYIVKIILLVKKPEFKRLHLKAAYLTFGAIAGFAAAVGVVIFCVMLDKDRYELKWAPYLNGAGGGLYILFGAGGYLSWRNHAQEEFEDDRSDYEKEFVDAKNHSHHPFLDRSISKQSAKSDVV